MHSHKYNEQKFLLGMPQHAQWLSEVFEFVTWSSQCCISFNRYNWLVVLSSPSWQSDQDFSEKFLKFWLQISRKNAKYTS